LADQLAFANHLYDLDSYQRYGSRPKRFEAQHQPRQSFDRTVVPLVNVVAIFDLSQFDAGVQLVVVVFDRRSVGSAWTCAKSAKRLCGRASRSA